MANRNRKRANGKAWDMEPLNNRKAIEEAISQWWRGGGTARRIADVLERENATPEVARIVGAKLAAAANRLSVITEPVIEAELEMAEAGRSAGKTPVDRGHDSARCNFDDQPCRECAAWNEGVDNDGNPYPDIIHGPLVVRT